jgi:hypothetical protein
MDPALASLLGAIVGGLIGGGSNVGLDVIRAKRARKATEATERRDARRAALLLAEELEAGRRLLASAHERGVLTWHPDERLLPAATWNSYSTDFALVATDDQWDAVSRAYADFDALNWHIRAVIVEDHYTGAEPAHPLEVRTLSPRTKQRIEEALENVDRALDHLNALRRLPPTS